MASQEGYDLTELGGMVVRKFHVLIRNNDYHLATRDLVDGEGGAGVAMLPL